LASYGGWSKIEFGTNFGLGIMQGKERRMNALKNALVSFVKDESGPTAVEYAVMLALIIVVCITAITALGTNANNTFSYIGTNVGKVGS
jgi:pilus assembly protein Flp/PilA